MSNCSSFGGTIDEIPDICVDNFTIYNRKAYFLSHCHCDHTEGLYTKKFLENLKQTNAYIYMSDISAEIVCHESNNKEISQYIKPLKLESTSITLESGENKDSYVINVKLIPAGHCFGSVMFLFETQNKIILYTGDFRINTEDISAYGQLHRDGQPIQITTMYVDTTFLNGPYNYFPRRKDTVREVGFEIKEWLAKSEMHRVVVTTSAKFGYENVFNELYHELGIKTYVQPDKWVFYRKFPSLIGITNDETTKIHLRTKKNIEADSHTSEDSYKYLRVHFSAQRHVFSKSESKAIMKDGRTLFVCYATHCSKSELVGFVSYFSPKKVVGFRDPYHEPLVEKRTLKLESCPSKKRRKDECEIKKVAKSVINDMFS